MLITGNAINPLSNAIVKELIISVKTVKIFLPHFFSLNNPIIAIININNSINVIIINSFQKKARADI